MSGRLWEQQRIVRYYLHRWPSARSMQPVRLQIKSFTGRHRSGSELEDLIVGLRPVPAGMGQLLPHRERVGEVRRVGPLRGVAAQTLADQEAGPQPACRPGEHLDAGLVPRPGPASAHGHKQAGTRRQRNHVQKMRGKIACTVRKEAGKRARKSTAPLTTNVPEHHDA
jgi:hypothetical protein